MATIDRGVSGGVPAADRGHDAQASIAAVGAEAEGGLGTAESTDAGSGGIDEVRRLRAAARRDRQAWPLALVALGLVVVGATPFYVFGSAQRFSLQVSETLGPLANIGAPSAPLGQWAGLYWVVALVVAILLIAVVYRRAAARRGIAGPLWPVVTAGLAMLVALVLLTPRIIYLRHFPSVAPLSTAAPSATSTLYFRGLTPLLVVALVVVVLAWTERSARLAIIAACYLALALVANLADLRSIGFATDVLSPGRFDELPNLLVPGAVLLLSGAFAALRRRDVR